MAPLGVAASGTSVDVAFIDIWRFEKGRLVESWVRMDLLGLLQQIGAIPS